MAGYSEETKPVRNTFFERLTKQIEESKIRISQSKRIVAQTEKQIKCCRTESDTCLNFLNNNKPPQ